MSGHRSAARVPLTPLDPYLADVDGWQHVVVPVANMELGGPESLLIRPFDPSAVKAIEKAIQQSEVGITPQNDGKFIRLAVPPLSEERRKQLSNQVKKMGEETKVSIRNIRRDALKVAEQEKKDSVITEDDLFHCKDEVQELTKTYEGKVDEVVAAKTQEIMTI